MRRVALGLVAVAALAAAPVMFGQGEDEMPAPGLDQTMARILAEWPKRLVLPDIVTRTVEASATEAARSGVPAPSMTEPFEIGEALNDPSRVADAVVSLLAVMRIGIVPDNTAMTPVTGAERLRVTAAEVRTLIAMGIADAEAAAANPDKGPFTFADLHRALSGVIRGMTVEQLAARYAETYEKNPNWLVPQVLQGRPIEPDAQLLRTQMWVMLADAVAPRPAQRRAGGPSPRLALAVTRASTLDQSPGGGPQWGTQSIIDPRVLATPEARFTDEEWQELLTRILGFAEGIMSLGPARAHEKHSGAGSPVQIQGRLNANAPVMVSSTTGRILLAAKSSSFSIAGLPVMWEYEDNLTGHGSMSVPSGDLTTVGPGGVAALTFTPKDETAKGRGELMRDSGRVDAYMFPKDIMVALYNIPSAAAGPIFSPGVVRVGTTNLTVEWHALDTIQLRLVNEYRVRILGALQRDGTDIGTATLELAPDGTYHGEIALLAIPDRTVLPGLDCRHGVFAAYQPAEVVGTPITERDSRGQLEGAFYNVVRSSPKFFQWDAGKPENYLRLEFYPKDAPFYGRLNKAGQVVRRSRPRCYDEIGGPIGPSGVRTPNFIPLNAAQWTLENAGYAIAIPAKGQELRYRDLTSSGAFFQSGKTLGGAIQQLAKGTDSKWHIEVNVPPER